MAKQTKRYSQSPYHHVPSLFTEEDLAMEEMAPCEHPAGPPVSFMSFGSGSSGNCAFIWDGTTGLLIDAGVDPLHVERSLARHGIGMEAVRGVLLTHDHSDHIRCVYKLAKSWKHLRVYCTPKTFNGVMRRHSIARRLKDYYEAIYKEFPFKIGRWEVTAFDVSHDGTDNCGYHLTNGAHTFTVATDLGCVTERVRHYMGLARNVVIESNYDAAMLAAGHYPAFLKARIADVRGHLDNVEAARFVAELYGADPGRLQRVFLCHLSHDNNTPARALEAVEGAVRALDPAVEIVRDTTRGASEAGGRMLLIDALPRFDASPLYTFREP